MRRFFFFTRVTRWRLRGLSAVSFERVFIIDAPLYRATMRRDGDYYHAYYALRRDALRHLPPS